MGGLPPQLSWATRVFVVGARMVNNCFVYDNEANLFLNDTVNYRIRRIIYNTAETKNIPLPQSLYSVFPNPTYGIFYVDNFSDSLSYTVYSSTGVQLISGILPHKAS